MREVSGLRGKNLRRMIINHTYNIDFEKGAALLDDGSVNTIVTSPPYYGLRDYGVAGQLGLEASPEEFIARMVRGFAAYRTKLRDDGTLWIVIGDSYAGSHKGGANYPENARKYKQSTNKGTLSKATSINTIGGSIKAKDLIGIPWMLAFALRADGWYLRQDIIWHKPNPMPESVKDRCTKSHEYVFLFSKSDKYYFDHEAIQTDAKDPADDLRRMCNVNPDHKSHPGKMQNGLRSGKAIIGGRKRQQANNSLNVNDPMFRHNSYREYEYNGRANKRSVWSVPTKPLKEAHFATYPEELIVDCIKAGCPEGGIVLDPFHGSGTTGIVANKLNRNYIGMELNPEYIWIEQRRRYRELGIFSNCDAL